ncbi:hypothetical protein QFC20_007184 [Naganishia adeliensis]|uniref:Uncharacterized protein n=1 Tax=Naganishia adeliensis TaxID=92952 RepID=A0ACC2V1V2_9TREE|nr:hypothetical protein QFC20_007184 [Naganishia adeliensis]
MPRARQAPPRETEQRLAVQGRHTGGSMASEGRAGERYAQEVGVWACFPLALLEELVGEVAELSDLLFSLDISLREQHTTDAPPTRSYTEESDADNGTRSQPKQSHYNRLRQLDDQSTSSSYEGSKESDEESEEDSVTSRSSVPNPFAARSSSPRTRPLSSINVTGAAFIRSQTKQLAQVATIDYTGSNALGNPVIEYLARHRQPSGQPVPLGTGDYSLITDLAVSTFTTPKTNEPYSRVSGYFSPIHIKLYFSDLAVLPGTITHGLWSSAATRRFVETVAAETNLKGSFRSKSTL